MNDPTARETTTPSAEPSNGPLTLSDRVRSLRLPERVPSARTPLTWLPWALCVLLAVVAGYFALRSFASSAADGSTTAGPSTPKQQPRDPAAKPAPGEIVLESKGWIIPVHRILVSPEVEGKILKLHIEEGMLVKKGAVLAELEQVKYQADLDRARAMKESAWQRYWELFMGHREEEIQSAKAEMEEMEAQREQLFQDFKRNSTLKTSQALADRDYEQAQSSFLAMDRRVARLRLQYKLMLDGPRAEKVDAAWADYEQILAEFAKTKWYFDNTKVYAPVSGTILTKQAEEGSKVVPQAFSNGISASLCEMADLTDLEVELAIAERDIARIFKGQKCHVRAEAFPQRVYEAYVSRLMPIADRSKASVPVRVKIRMRDENRKFVFNDEGEGYFLRPEMGAVVTFYKRAGS